MGASRGLRAMPSDDDAEFLKHEQPIVARPRCHPPETNAEAHLKVFLFFCFLCCFGASQRPELNSNHKFAQTGLKATVGKWVFGLCSLAPGAL